MIHVPQTLHRIADCDDPHSPTFMVFCPGCRCGHALWVNKPNAGGHRWTFDGNMEKPTFAPSVLIERAPRCHSYIRAGNIEFLPDCGHALAGKTVPLESF